MDKVLRIEIQYENMKKTIVHGYVYTDDTEMIERCMAGQLKDHPMVYLYTKRGKKPIHSFMG